MIPVWIEDLGVSLLEVSVQVLIWEIAAQKCASNLAGDRIGQILQTAGSLFVRKEGMKAAQRHPRGGPADEIFPGKRHGETIWFFRVYFLSVTAFNGNWILSSRCNGCGPGMESPALLYTLVELQTVMLSGALGLLQSPHTRPPLLMVSPASDSHQFQ